MKFKVVSAIIVIIVVLIGILLGTAIKNNAVSEGSQTEQVQ